MSNLREAAQQALEALKTYVPVYNDYWERGMEILQPMGEDAISKLEAALAKPDDKAQPVAQVVEDLEAIPFRKVAWLGQDLPVGTNLYAAPQPPAEQEPKRPSGAELKRLAQAAREAYFPPSRHGHPSFDKLDPSSVEAWERVAAAVIAARGGDK